MPLIRAVALNVIKSLVPLNLPGSQVINYLQQLNLTYRRTEMLADIRTAFDRIKYEAQVTKLMPGQRVPESWMNKEEFTVPYKYRVHMKVDYYDPDTQEYTTEHRYMFSDDKMSVGDYAEQFPDYALSKDYVQEKDYAGVQVVGVSMNTRAGAVPF